MGRNFEVFFDGDVEECLLPIEILCVCQRFFKFVDCIEPQPKEPEALRKAWKKYIQTTWPDPTYLEDEQYKDCAFEMSESFHGYDRDLFLQGCLTEGEGLKTALKALNKMKKEWGYLDPLVYAKDIICPVTIIHGKGDGVIPVNQVERFRKALLHNQGVTTCVTGLFSSAKMKGRREVLR